MTKMSRTEEREELAEILEGIEEEVQDVLEFIQDRTERLRSARRSSFYSWVSEVHLWANIGKIRLRLGHLRYALGMPKRERRRNQ